MHYVSDERWKIIEIHLKLIHLVISDLYENDSLMW